MGIISEAGTENFSGAPEFTTVFDGFPVSQLFSMFTHVGYCFVFIWLYLFSALIYCYRYNFLASSSFLTSA